MNNNVKKITINNNIYILSLEYILGLFEGDGSITIQLKPNPSHKTGKQVVLIFEIHQHAIDMDLLKAISIYLGCGKVEIGRKVGAADTWVYRLRISTQIDILNILLPILQPQSMMLNKREHDLKFFICACLLVKDKKHTTIEGQSELANITSELSSKLSLEKKQKLPNSKKPLNAERITGFTDAEGHFSFAIIPSKLDSNYTGVNFNFTITQESSEIVFLNNLKQFFGCGNVFTDNRGGGRFVVNSKKDLINIIIPFFEVNELQTIKKYSFLRFKKALEICITNKPLLKSHIDELKNILSETTNKRPKK